MVVLGAGLLWFGWFGFNAGSALTAGGLASSAFVATNTAAAAAAFTWMILSWIYRRPTLLGTVTGAVVGLVAITPAAGFVTPMAGIPIGIIAAVISYYAMVLFKIKTRLGRLAGCVRLSRHGRYRGVLWPPVSSPPWRSTPPAPTG